MVSAAAESLPIVITSRVLLFVYMSVICMFERSSVFTYTPEINVPALFVAPGKMVFWVTCYREKSHRKGDEQSEKGRRGSHIGFGRSD